MKDGIYFPHTFILNFGEIIYRRLVIALEIDVNNDPIKLSERGILT
jgi:hypothetical protein